jgi:hypothetical protein
MSWEDVLQGILGGAGAPSSDPSSGQTSKGGPLADLLGGILGGVSPHQATGSQGRAGGLPDLLGGILGGADGKLDVGDIAGILGGILGGAAPAGGTQSTPGGLGDILGGILGGAGSAGGSQPPPGGLGGILGGGTLGANSFLTPIITELAQRLGLPPAMASAVVSFVLGKLLSGSAQSAGRAPAPERQGLDLDHLLETIGSGQQLQPSYLQSTGLVDELSQRTRIDKATALESLQQVLAMLGGQLAAGPAPREQAAASDLDHLLDTWQD